MARGKKVKKKTTTPERAKTAYTAFFVGLFLCGMSIFMALSFLTADITLDPINGGDYCSTGLIGSWIAYGSILSFGKVASFFMAVLVFFWGSLVMKIGKFFVTWVNVLGGILMLFAVSILSGLLGSEGFYSGGLLSEIVLPYASLYGGGLGVFMLSAVIFVTGMVLAFGTRIFSAAEWFGEVVVGLVLSSLRGMVRVCRESRDTFSPKIKRAMLTAGAGVAAPMRGAKKAAREHLTERAEKAAARRAAEPELEEVDSESGVIIDAEVVGEDSLTVEPPAARERVVVSRNVSERTPVVEDNAEPVVEEYSDPVVNIVDDLEPEDDIGITESNNAEVSDSAWESAEDEEVEEENNPYARLAAEDAAKKVRIAEEENSVAGAERMESDHPYKLPPLDLLDPIPERKGGNPAALAKRAKILESLLADFRIQGQVVHIERGPRITQFEISLAPGIKLSRVSGLQDNIAMVLKAPSIRIIAPIRARIPLVLRYRILIRNW